MARKPRLSVAGVAEHVIQRGNNKQAIFESERDATTYLKWLGEYAEKFDVAIHAWVLMNNHVHVLCTPNAPFAVSKMMHSLGLRYAQYFNRKYCRSGTLWEGRFKSCLIESEPYLLTAYMYIELNPVRAGLAASPAQYKWSSFHCNGLGWPSELITPHALYLKLGETAQKRSLAYRELFSTMGVNPFAIGVRSKLGPDPNRRET